MEKTITGVSEIDGGVVEKTVQLTGNHFWDAMLEENAAEACKGEISKPRPYLKNFDPDYKRPSFDVS